MKMLLRLLITACSLWVATKFVSGITFTGDPKHDPSLTLVGSQFGWLMFRIAFLFVMALSGSFISQKGINLYFSAIQGTPVTLLHKPVETPLIK